MAAPRPTSLVVVSRAGLTLGAAVGLERVYAGGSWFIAVAIAALLPPLLFEWGDRRGWHPLAVLAALGVLGALFAVAVDDPSETVLGVPTRSAVQQLGRDLGTAFHVLRSAKVPVAPVGAALVLSVLATLGLAAMTELVARRLDAPIGAIGPSIALYVGVAALGSGPWAAVTAVYALVVIAYLIALQYVENTARRTWFQTARHRRSQSAAGGFLAGAAVVALATMVGPAFPGARGAAWLNYRSLGSGHGDSVLHAADPLVSIAAKLDANNPNKEVFTVKSSIGYRWRVIALDKFQNNDWAVSEDPKDISHLPGPIKSASASIVRQTFVLSGLDAIWLPAAYRPVSIKVPNASVLPSSSTLYIEKGQLANVSYTVESEIMLPNPDQLEAVTFDDLRDQDADLKLPSDFPADVTALAQQVTKNATTPFDKARALQSYFQDHDRFRYVLNPNLGTNTQALHNFLFKVRAGFCEQFAAAFAEMARAVHLPTRVAVGYEPGVLNPSDGLWHVTERQAHAWPEVWLGKDIGWYAFEPTPGHVTPDSHLGDTGVQGGGTSPTTPTSVGPATSIPKSGRTTPPVSNPKKVDVNSPDAASTTKHHSNGWHHVLIAMLVLAVLAVIALGALIVIAWRRTRRRRTDPDPRRRVLGAWNEALERLSVAGVVPKPSATAIEFALRQAPAQGAGSAGPPLMDLARLQTAAMYAPAEPSPEEADTAWARVDAIDDALRGVVPRTDRWIQRLRPRRRARMSEAI